MAQIENLRPGQDLSNEELCDTFSCGPQGGMRRALRTNSLVLVCNHVESIYDDRWIARVLHYTGMGQSGDQSLAFMQNKTLAESGSNGVHVHLFEPLRCIVIEKLFEMFLSVLFPQKLFQVQLSSILALDFMRTVEKDNEMLFLIFQIFILKQFYCSIME